MSGADESFDVVVVGSGGAGVAAALSARHHGVTAVVLERSDKLGGTTAVSAGVPWIPNNHHMDEIGSSDSREQALTYLRALSLGGMDLELAEVYVDEAPELLQFLETETPLSFSAISLPDYHPEKPGGTAGRSVEPALFPVGELGDLRPHLRSTPCIPIPLCWQDLQDGFDSLDLQAVGDRIAKGLVGTGEALMAGLIKGAVDKGVEFRRNARARRLVIEDGTVVGLEYEAGGKTRTIAARRAVILASGGFEWNEELVKDHVAGPVEASLSPPFNEGDGLIMAMEARAAIANTKEAYWMPALGIPGEEYDGRQLYRLTAGERADPRSIMVNRAGKRFVNEAHNYSDVGRAMHNFDEMAFDYPNLPAWIVVDDDFMKRYPFGPRLPGEPVPDWLETGATLRELAGRIGVDPDGLEATVERFNDHVARGWDPDFGRGTSRYDLAFADRSRRGALQTLGPIENAPFYACRVYSGVLGTKGGAKINARSEVLDTRGEPIDGLYAAGNVSAGFTGMAYPGGGGTVGPALVFGHIAGRNAAARENAFQGRPRTPPVPAHPCSPVATPGVRPSPRGSKADR
ncbi:FAD-dependent oxidoreductase [Streptomyces violaceusniger]|uniref:Fumarate reductase/succinate dehydrogenase flavoprotein domain protein n=1 Tax=Streptomyces violaceusniger (strain Tu 4113) TaxID=653045 RepID=G2P510_STRV4|nr:FAD-dependent oxidoreductase [Streptomyces violaceusniger]AEM84187.1 fumarate reductase/succinate dehydrogenase flavoprotein domain protein [Streptomyces violaceusniger Tu 4113]